MKHRGVSLFLGLAALATGAVAVAEAEDALLRRYPYDPACAWGRVGNGKGMVVRCISEDEAKVLRAAAVPLAGAAKPAASAATPPGSTKTDAAPSAPVAPSSTSPEADAEDAPVTDPAAPAGPVSGTLEVTVGPVTADEGTLGIGKLGMPKDRYADCVQKNGGLSAKTGEVQVRFLVRGKGIAEGVSVSKRQNISKEAAQCVAEVIDRRRVGSPESPMVGATIVVKFAKVEK